MDKEHDIHASGNSYRVRIEVPSLRTDWCHHRKRRSGDRMQRCKMNRHEALAEMWMQSLVFVYVWGKEHCKGHTVPFVYSSFLRHTEGRQGVQVSVWGNYQCHRLHPDTVGCHPHRSRPLEDCGNVFCQDTLGKYQARLALEG